MLEVSLFYTCAPKITIIWCTVPEIRSETDRLFLSFCAIFCNFTTTTNDPKNQNFEKKWKKMPGDIIFLYIHVYHKSKSYDIRFLKYKVRQTKIFVIFGHFCPFSLLTTQKIKILKLKKAPGDISFYKFAP